jgi:succinylarginine dihydrolase
VTVEVNFDGLVGPTHNYAGLSVGNRASMANAGLVSNPQAAALQGLAKMRSLVDLGLVQAVLPPHQRPDPRVLAQLGFGAGHRVADLAQSFPELLGTVMSASAMWTANAATVSASADTADGRVHLTPANLVSIPHRSFEPPQTTAILRRIFADPERFVVHDPLPSHARFADEGAANHSRLASAHGEPGIEVFVFGRDGDDPLGDEGSYPRRQTRLAGALITRSHGLDPARVRFVRQSAAAVDAGAFHNDVVAVVDRRVVFHHQDAFADGDEVAAAFPDATLVTVGRDEVPLEDAVRSYLFNSQLVAGPDGACVLVAPADAMAVGSTAAYLERAVADPANPIAVVQTVDLRQSMSNGGGPACLRLRVVLTAAERAALAGSVLVDHGRLDRLETWVRGHYRDRLHPDDLADPQLEEEANAALDELTTILGLGSLYPFQQ